MPELNFFLSQSEGLQLAEFFLERNCWLAPDRHYDSPVHEKLRTLEEVRQAQHEANWFSVGRDDYCTLPLELHQITDGPNARPENVGKYYIMSRNGGAVIDLSLGRLPKLEDKDSKLGTASLSYYPYFWLPNLAGTYDAPVPMKLLYKEAANLIRRLSRPLRIGGRVYRVFEEAIDLLSRGCSLSMTNWEDSRKVLAVLPPARRRRPSPKNEPQPRP